MSQHSPNPSGLWLPSPPALHLVPTREAEIVAPRVGVSGHFTVEVVHAATGDVRQRLQFDNLITDAGLNAIGTSNIYSMSTHIAVGTGTTPPAVTDTALQAEVFRTNRAVAGGDTYGMAVGAEYHWYRKTREFWEHEANGTLTELGIFSSASGPTLWSRQLFKDANGQPATVTKTSFDRLRITYEWRVYPPPNPAANTTETVTISGVTHTVVTATHNADYMYSWGTQSVNDNLANGMLMNLGRFTNIIGVFESNAVPTFTGEMPTTGSNVTGGVQAAYSPGSFQREGEWVVGATVGNFATGIGAIGSMKTSDAVGTYASPFVHCLTPKIAKTDALKLTVRLRIGWGRYTG